MQAIAPKDYNNRHIPIALKGIPFFNATEKEGPEQFQALIDMAEVFEFAPGDTVIQQGAQDRALYFLLRGELAVYSSGDNQGWHQVNTITPGEIFGALAMIRHSTRTATVAVPSDGKAAMILALDVSLFEHRPGYSRIDIITKITFYRMVSHSIRWKLEQYRREKPFGSLFGKLRDIKVYIGPKDGSKELEALILQAKQLADLLIEWNELMVETGE